jgi:hypothetical protein
MKSFSVLALASLAALGHAGPVCHGQGNSLLANGDFECSLAGWTPTRFDPAASGAVTSPGNTGFKSFEVTFKPPAVSPSQGTNFHIETDPFVVKPGTTYLLSYSTWFGNADAGFIGVMINGKPKRTVDARDFGANVWHGNELAWTAGPADKTVTVGFDFVFGNAPPSKDRIDSVKFVPLPSCDAAPWPGLLPNGGFDCGIGSWVVQVPDTAAKASVVNTGQYSGDGAFEVSFIAPRVSDDGGVSARITSKKIKVKPGTTYELSYFAYFSEGAQGFIGVMVNGVPIQTKDANDGGPPGGFYKEGKATWTAGPGVTSAAIRYEFIFSATSVNRLDNIVFKAVGS